MGVDYRDRVISFIRATGPVLPVQIAKEMKTNILMASAMLSELSSKGTVKVSSLKVGGSPLYYLPGQESLLLNFAQSLNEKDRRTLDALQHARVLRDTDQDALTRVSLRTIKDFAHPLNVTHDGTTEIFWKWHSLPDADASGVIKSILTGPIPVAQPATPPPQQVQRPAPRAQRVVQQDASQPVLHAPEPRQKMVPAKPKLKPSRPRIIPQTSVIPAMAYVVAQPTPPMPHLQQSVLEDPALSDPFFKELQAWCQKGNIKILEHTLLKRKQDYDLVLEIPSPVGALVYYAKARNKQKLNDADLSAAFVQGQLKKLPAMLVAPGELNKKGTELLERDLRGLVFARMH